MPRKPSPFARPSLLDTAVQDILQSYRILLLHTLVNLRMLSLLYGLSPSKLILYAITYEYMVFLAAVKIWSSESGIDEIGRLLAMCEVSEIPLVKFDCWTKLYAFLETNRQTDLFTGQ
jgi:hypothetical protein